MFRLRADEKGVTLLADVDPSIPEIILGDQMKLRQILVNLIGNAIKFTDKGEVRSFSPRSGPPSRRRAPNRRWSFGWRIRASA